MPDGELVVRFARECFRSWHLDDTVNGLAVLGSRCRGPKGVIL